MKFTLTTYRTLTSQLKRLNDLIDRLATDYESRMKQEGFEVPLRVKLSKEEAAVEISYTNEEDAVLDEIRAEMGKSPTSSADEDEDV